VNLGGLHKMPFDLELVTACVGEVNTAVRQGTPWPIVYGIGEKILWKNEHALGVLLRIQINLVCTSSTTVSIHGLKM
jgi:hypothetical protein